MAPSPTSLLHLAHRLTQIGAERFTAQVGNEMTPRQVVVMTAISANPDMSQTALVGETGIDRSTMASIVKRLVKRGLVKRRRDRSDARAYVVTITPAGEAALATAAPVMAGIEAQILNAFPAKDRERFMEMLVKLTSVAV